MICVSINYKKASAEIRGKFAYAPDERRAVSEMLSREGAEGTVILCTCSRTEIYVCGSITTDDVISAAEKYSGIKNIKRYAMIFNHNAAVNHLFRVAGGMDSMVLGEDEILGQTRNAYKEALSLSAEMNMIFQAALACAKRIKLDTSLSGVPVSTATLAANEAVRFGNTVLMIGASGKIGSSTLKNILSHRGVNVIITARKHIPYIDSQYADRVRIVPYEDRYSCIDGADCIISATSCPVYTITYDRAAEHIRTQKPRLFIDLSVPRDIDESISSMENTRLMGIDHFERLADNNNEIKLSAREKAEAIISEETEALRKNLAMRRLMNASPDRKKPLSDMSPEEIMCRLKAGLDAEHFEQAVKLLLEG